MNPWHDARRRHRHPRLRNPHAFGQQAHRLHEVVIVQEGFAHAHEDDIDALQRRLNSLLPKHRRDLPHDLSRLQIPLDPKQRRETKLAIHSTAHLARNAKRSPATTRSASLPASISSPASLPSPLSPPSPSGIQTVSTVSPSASSTRYRTVPSLEMNLRAIPGSPTPQPCSARRVRYSSGNVET